MRMMLTVVAGLALAGSVPALARTADRSGGDPTERNRAVITAFAEQFYGRRDVRGAFERFVVPDYTQHNPGLPDGREAAIEALRPKFEVAGARFEVKRILVDGDLAMIHLRARPDAPNGGGAVADIYRLKDGKIVEHWDVIQPWPRESKNPHPMF